MKVIRSKQARKLSLRVSRLDGSVRLTLPHGVSQREAVHFIQTKSDWIAQHVAAIPTRAPIEIGTTLPLLGQPVPIVAGAKGPARWSGHDIEVPPHPVTLGPKVMALIKTMARTHFTQETRTFADRLGLRVGQIRIRDTRSRWGSCTSKGDLMFSWRLMMAPPAVGSYVAAHEVAHLRHMDHSKRFWALVAELMPDYAVHRAWLKANGAELLAWDFSASSGAALKI